MRSQGIGFPSPDSTFPSAELVGSSLVVLSVFRKMSRRGRPGPPWRPLVQLDSPSWLVPMCPLDASRHRAPLLRFLVPSAHEEGESTSLRSISSRTSLRSAAWSSRLSIFLSHQEDYGIACRFSQPHSDFFLSIPSHHFQMGSTLGIPLFRDLILIRSVCASSARLYPLVVSRGLDCRVFHLERIDLRRFAR